MQQTSGQTLVVVNYVAARARRAWPLIKNALAESGVRFDAYESVAAGEAEKRVRLALREGYQTVAAVGGDGTLSEVARGFFECPVGTNRDNSDDAGGMPRPVNASAVLAVLPAGTGDDFARGLEQGRRVPLENWLRRFIEYHKQPVDAKRTRLADTILATVNEIDGSGARRFVCLNSATVGFSADVVTRVSRQAGAWRRLGGEARFALAAVGALAAWRNREVRVAVDDAELVECATNLIAVANGAYAGGGMKFAPSARVDDGRLEVLAACGVSRGGVMRELARIHRGGHVANPKIIFTSGTRVRVETVETGATLAVEADGDMRGYTPAEFRVMPGALRLVF
ncbi:MAG TPA: diacylglycerol kinase family protein [Pyrinomonadaceae bacterium]